MAANIDNTKGRIKIPADAVSGLTFPITIKVTFPDGEIKSYTTTGLPWTLSNLEQAGDYYFLLKGANGLMLDKTQTLHAIDCSEGGGNPTFSGTDSFAECTDSDIDVTPIDMLNGGFTITKAEIIGGHGTVTANTNYTHFTYNVPNPNYSGTVRIEFYGVNGSETKTKVHTLGIGCDSAPPSGDAPAVAESTYCTSGPIDVTPNLPEGWTLIQLLTPNGLNHGSWNASLWPQIVYTPKTSAGQGNSPDVENFGYLAEDANGVEQEGAIEITINCPAPVAPTLNLSMICDQGTIPVFKDIWQLVENANPHSSMHLSSLSNGTNGNVHYVPGATSQGNGWQYTLNNTNATSDQLTYTITDGAARSVTGVVNIAITASGDCGQGGGGGILPPVEVEACDGAVFVPVAIPSGWTFVGFSHNNTTNSNKGTLSQNMSGQWYFTPAEGFTEDYVFTYTVRNNETAEEETTTITVSYNCNPCDLDIEAKYCPSGFIRGSIVNQTDLGNNQAFQYNDGDILEFYYGIPNDGSQAVATVDIEVLDGNGHNVLQANPIKFTLDVIGSYIHIRYRVNSACSGFVSEWSEMIVTRDDSQSGISTTYPVGSNLMYYPPFVKMIVPDGVQPTHAVFALEDPNNTSATQNIQLLNPDGSSASVGADIILDPSNLQSQHINGSGGKLYGYILIDGCDAPIKTPVIEIPAFSGLPFEG